MLAAIDLESDKDIESKLEVRENGVFWLEGRRRDRKIKRGDIKLDVVKRRKDSLE